MLTFFLLMIIFVQRGWTSLMKACYQGHNEIIDLLLAAGAKIDLKNQVSLKCTLFFCLIHFFKYFPRALLISECAKMGVQFKGGNKTRVDSITLATLSCSNVCSTLSSFSPNKHEICTRCDKST